MHISSHIFFFSRHTILKIQKYWKNYKNKTISDRNFYVSFLCMVIVNFLKSFCDGYSFGIPSNLGELKSRSLHTDVCLFLICEKLLPKRTFYSHTFKQTLK